MVRTPSLFRRCIRALYGDSLRMVCGLVKFCRLFCSTGNAKCILLLSALLTSSSHQLPTTIFIWSGPNLSPKRISKLQRLKFILIFEIQNFDPFFRRKSFFLWRKMIKTYDLYSDMLDLNLKFSIFLIRNIILWFLLQYQKIPLPIGWAKTFSLCNCFRLYH